MQDSHPRHDRLAADPTRWLAPLLCVVLLVTLLAGCAGGDDNEASSEDLTPTTPATMGTPPSGDTVTVTATATATATAPSDIAPSMTTTPTTETLPVRPTPKLAVTPIGSPPAPTITRTPTRQPTWIPTVQAAQTATTLAENWCPPETASLLITWFVEAFNAGDRAALLALLPDLPVDGAPDTLDSDDDPTRFYEFTYITEMIEPSVTPGVPRTPEQDAVVDWLLTRHADGERWEIAGIDVDEVRQREVLRIPAISEAVLGWRVVASEREPWTMMGVVQVNCEAKLVITWKMIANPLPEEWQ